MDVTIAVERSVWIAASRERAWQAVTQAEQLEKWYAPTFKWEIPALKVGAQVKFYNSEMDILHATIEILEQPARFRLRWEGDPELVTTFTLIEEKGGTRVTIHETGYGEHDQEQIDQMTEGYGMSMENLKAYLEGRSIVYTGDDPAKMMVAERSAIIKADQARVWRAITEAAQISQWFDGSMKWEFKPAAGEKMTFYYDGKVIGYGKVVAAEPIEQFAFHWTPEPGNPVESLVTFRLETVTEGTRVTITEAGFEALPDTLRQKRYDMNAMGWGIALDHLTAYLQTRET